MKLSVTPVYGWGWTSQESKTEPVPPPFELDVSVVLADAPRPFRIALGQIRVPGHPLDGMWIELTARTKEGTNCNLEAFADRPDFSAGFYPGNWEFSGFAEVHEISN